MRTQHHEYARFVYRLGLASLLLLGGAAGLWRIHQAPAAPENGGRDQQRSEALVGAAAGHGGDDVSVESELSGWKPPGRSPALRMGKASLSPEEMLIAQITALAKSEPWFALVQAEDQTDAKLRIVLLKIALRGLGAKHAEEGAAWILGQEWLPHEEAAAALLSGISTDEEARRIAESLIQRDGGREREYGLALVNSRLEGGRFAEAAALAANLQGGCRQDWLHAGYSAWAGAEPQAALDGAEKLPEGLGRQAGFEAVAEQWAATDPQGFAEKALNLANSGEREFAMDCAIQTWAEKDAAGARAWLLSRARPDPALDGAMLLVATQPQFVRENPIQASQWADMISNENSRSNAIALILTQGKSAGCAALLH